MNPVPHQRLEGCWCNHSDGELEDADYDSWWIKEIYFLTRNPNESFSLTLTAAAAAAWAALQWQRLKVELCCTLDPDRLKQTQGRCETSSW